MSSKRLITIGLLFTTRLVLAQRPPPSLGTAASFAVLAPTVTSSGATIVTGNLGGSAIYGFPPGLVLLGTSLHEVEAPLHDVAAAYDDLRTRSCGQALEGDGLAPGVYCLAAPFTLNGTLTLDAHNDPNAVWIFQLGGGLTTATASGVRVINGGWEGNVFWQVNGQAVLGNRTAFVGNILASKGITFGAGASLSGRALVLDGTATLNGNSISLCCKPIEVINPTNSSATATESFSATFTQTGGAAPVTFTLGSGTLPADVRLAANGTLSGTPAKIGTYSITVRVTDATHCTGTSATYVINVGCAPITITHPTKNHGVVGEQFGAMFTQMGAVDPYLFTASNLPNGLTLETNGLLHGVPKQGGVFPITVAVTGADTCSFVSPVIYVLTIDCQTITVIPPNNTCGTAGVKFSAQFGQTGAIGTPTYALASGTLPAGLKLSPQGLLCGTTNQTGSFPITVIVGDDDCCTGTSQPYVICINCQTISVIAPVTNSGTTGIPFCETFTATGILGTVTFSSTGALPAGVTFTSSGMLCGTPTQTGCFPITVTATDTNGCTATTPYTLCISGVNPQPCPPIAAGPATLPPAVVAVPYLQTIIPSGGTAPYTFTIIGGVLPAGLALNSATGVISGVPTVSDDIAVVIRITDATGYCGAIVYYVASIPVISPVGIVLLAMLMGLIGAIVCAGGTPK